MDFLYTCIFLSLASSVFVFFRNWFLRSTTDHTEGEIE